MLFIAFGMLNAYAFLDTLLVLNVYRPFSEGVRTRNLPNEKLEPDGAPYALLVSAPGVMIFSFSSDRTYGQPVPAFEFSQDYVPPVFSQISSPGKVRGHYFFSVFRIHFI